MPLFLHMVLRVHAQQRLAPAPAQHPQHLHQQIGRAQALGGARQRADALHRGLVLGRRALHRPDHQPAAQQEREAELADPHALRRVQGQRPHALALADLVQTQRDGGAVGQRPQHHPFTAGDALRRGQPKSLGGRGQIVLQMTEALRHAVAAVHERLHQWLKTLSLPRKDRLPVAVPVEHGVELGPERLGLEQRPGQLDLAADVAAPGVGGPAHRAEVGPAHPLGSRRRQKIQRQQHRGEVGWGGVVWWPGHRPTGQIKKPELSGGMWARAAGQPCRPATAVCCAQTAV